MADNKVITDYGYFTIEKGKEEIIWFHSVANIKPIKVVKGDYREDIANNNIKQLKDIGENKEFKFTYLSHESRLIYLDNKCVQIEKLSDGDRFKMNVVSDRTVRNYSGKIRMADGERYFDIEYVDGEAKQIPDIRLLCTTLSEKRAGEVIRRNVIVDVNEESLNMIPESENAEIKARICLNKKDNEMVIYLNDKDTVVLRPGKTAEEILEYRKTLMESKLKEVKQPTTINAKGEETYLCRIAGVMFENPDGVSREEIIKDIISEVGCYNRCTTPGLLVTSDLSTNSGQAIEVHVNGKLIGYVPADSKTIIYNKGLLEGGSVLVKLRYDSMKNAYSGWLYAPDTLPTTKMESTVKKIIKANPSLEAPERTFIAHSLFLDEHIKEKKQSSE